MSINRRNFIQGSSTAVLSSYFLTSPAAAFATPNDKPRLVLHTGLQTDAPFTRGIAMANTQSLNFAQNPNDFGTLLDLLNTHTGQDVLALVKTSDALLIEQAVRDNHKHAMYQAKVYAPRPSEQKVWAQGIGIELSTTGRLENTGAKTDEALTALLIQS